MKKVLTFFLLGVLSLGAKGFSDVERPAVFELKEVEEPANTQVRVRTHPRTGKPYVAITGQAAQGGEPVTAVLNMPAARPDYRMLDWKRKPGEIPYEGPVSDRKKVYLFAATIAAAGVTAGILTPVAPAAGAGASGGAAGYAAGGAAVTGTTAVIAAVQTKPDEKSEDFRHEAASKVIE